MFDLENFAFEKTMYQLDFLKTVLIALGVLILLPILRVVGVIGKGLALTLFFVVVAVLILYGVYQLYYKSLNRDENDFSKLDNIFTSTYHDKDFNLNNLIEKYKKTPTKFIDILWEMADVTGKELRPNGLLSERLDYLIYG